MAIGDDHRPLSNGIAPRTSRPIHAGAAGSWRTLKMRDRRKNVAPASRLRSRRPGPQIGNTEPENAPPW
jgi:hypothetical protein